MYKVNVKKIYILCLFFCFFTCSSYAHDVLIGTITNDPPFEFKNSQNTLSGFDIDLMNGLCQRMQVHCIFKEFKFQQLFSALNKKEIDVAISAIIITPERQKKFLFSLPYKFNHQQFVTLTDSKLQHSFQLRGKTIGVYRGSPEERDTYKQFDGDIHLKAYDSVNQMVAALQNKKVDAIILEYHRALYWLSNSNDFKPLSQQFQDGDGYGIATQLGNTNLIASINSALLKMEQDGSYLKIYKTYF